MVGKSQTEHPDAGSQFLLQDPVTYSKPKVWCAYSIVDKIVTVVNSPIDHFDLYIYMRKFIMLCQFIMVSCLSQFLVGVNRLTPVHQSNYWVELCQIVAF